MYPDGPKALPPELGGGQFESDRLPRPAWSAAILFEVLKPDQDLGYLRP